MFNLNFHIPVIVYLKKKNYPHSKEMNVKFNFGPMFGVLHSISVPFIGSIFTYLIRMLLMPKLCLEV